MKNKIFGLGLARTGTTSLHHAMGILGFDSAPNSVALLDELDIAFLAAHDAFFDNPIPFCYEELDGLCVNSRWIVTQRPLDRWLKSMRWLFGPGLARLDPDTRAVGDRVHRSLYGIEQFDEARLRTVYQEHYEALAGWVEGRDAIWIHVEDGVGWEPICELLGVAVPTVPFPHHNRRSRSGRLRAMIRRP